MSRIGSSRLALGATLALSAAISIAGAGPASSGVRNDGGNYVTAESRHGNGAISGQVRPGRRGGLEVQLPGGTWVGCRRSCSETLRAETIDFWENQGSMIGAGTLQNECGVFGCLEIGR